MLCSCRGAGPLRLTDEDLRLDRAWLALQRGDLDDARRQGRALDDPLFRERLDADILAAEEGRAVALMDRLAAGSWLAARYDASAEVARERLRTARRAEVDHPVLWFELARRAGTTDAALSALDAVENRSPGGLEARAEIVGQLLDADRGADAERACRSLGLDLASAIVEPSASRAEAGAAPGDLPVSARARWLQRRVDADLGRYLVAAAGLVDDLEDGCDVPQGLVLLRDILAALPDAELEARTRAALARTTGPGWRLARARDRLAALLDERAGALDDAVADLDRLRPRSPEEDALRERLERRAHPEAGEPGTLEERADAGERDPESVASRELRLAREWDLAARASYRDVLRGDGPDFGRFLGQLDAAGRRIEGAPSLADLPRHDYGLFGERLDAEPLRATLPDAFVLSGQALTLPADMAWFDRVGCEARTLPGSDAGYELCRVRRPRVTGFLASRGIVTTGAGIDDTVFLDLDRLELEIRSLELLPEGRALVAQPAAGREQRLDLREPLDVVPRLERAVRADAGDDFGRVLLETLAAHEAQHIADFQSFLSASLLGRTWMVLSAGALPGNVRVEIERRAQLRALREAPDPRLALAHVLGVLPVDDPGTAGEHALAYERLAREFLEALDAGAWSGARPLEDLGLDPRRRLVQQLDRLDADTVRAIARALPD